MNKNILIVGAGYVGLATGIVYFEHGHNVIFYDIDKEKINNFKNKKPTYYEPGLLEAISNIPSNNFISSLEELNFNPDFIFICVNTPSNEDGSVSLDYVLSSVKEIKNKFHNQYDLIIKSTVPPGTNKMIKEILGNNINVINNPEFLSQGTSLKDAREPNRIVVGSDDDVSKFIELLNIFSCPIVKCKPTSSELAKYASNAFLALKVSFINEMLCIAEDNNADVNEVASIMGLDPRIGNKFLKAGSGFGGPCFKKDVYGLSHLENKAGIKNGFAKLTNEFNENHKGHIVEVLKKKYKNLKGLKIGLTGLTYKENTSSVMNAPSLIIFNKLKEEGSIISVYDSLADLSSFDCKKENTIEELINNSDIVIDCLNYKIIKG